MLNRDVNTNLTSGYVETDGTVGNWVNAHPQGTNGVFELDACPVDGGCGSSASEPGTCVLLGAGLLGVLALATRR